MTGALLTPPVRHRTLEWLYETSLSGGPFSVHIHLLQLAGLCARWLCMNTAWTRAPTIGARSCSSRYGLCTAGSVSWVGRSSHISIFPAVAAEGEILQTVYNLG